MHRQGGGRHKPHMDPSPWRTSKAPPTWCPALPAASMCGAAGLNLMLHTLARTGRVRRGTGASHNPHTCTCAQYSTVQGSRLATPQSVQGSIDALSPCKVCKQQAFKQHCILWNAQHSIHTTVGCCGGHNVRAHTFCRSFVISVAHAIIACLPASADSHTHSREQ
jgi:hypothetical protein